MKNLKKLVSFICCLSLALSLCQSIYATENISKNSEEQGFFEDFSGEKIADSTNFSTLNSEIEYKIQDSLVKEFNVVQSAGAQSRENVGGFSMVADFEGGYPEKVYFKRIKGKNTSGSPFDGTALAIVINPKGDVVSITDFSDVTDEETERELVVEIPRGEAMVGPWTFRFSTSFTGNNGYNSDTVSIGLKNPKNWGIRGEYMLYNPSYAEEEAWIYVPEKVDNLFVSTSIASYPITIYKENGTVLGKTEERTKGWYSKSIYESNSIGSEAVYNLGLKRKANGTLPYGILIDYAPSLICPTKEMAWALKGGWQETSDGLLVQGGLQKRAREEVLRLFNEKTLNIYLDAVDAKGNKINDPENGYFVKPTIDRTNKIINGIPYEESERLLAYLSISSKRNILTYEKTQNMDKESPYFGSFVKDEDEVGYFEQGKHKGLIDSSAVYSSLVNFDHPYNIFYNSEILANRQAMACLSAVVALSEDFFIKDNDISSDGAITHGNFHYSYLARDYNNVRHLLDDETVEILDEAMINLAYSMGTMYGRGPTNQWLFNVNGVLHSYYATRDEAVKGILYRHLEGMSKEQAAKGYSKGGYFIEGGGCDGSNYHLLSQSLYYKVYENVQKYEPDNVYLGNMKNIIEKNLEFATLFELPRYGASYYGTNATTSRMANNMSCYGGHVTFLNIFDEFPVAMRLYELTDIVRVTDDDKSVNGDNIDNNITKYVNIYEWTQVTNNDLLSYNAIKNYDNGKAVSSELLPTERESGIWEFEDSIIALKNKGLFLNVFYSPNGGSVPANSFMGGGATILFADNVGGIIGARKPIGFVVNSGFTFSDFDQILSTCIVGKKEDGTLFYTGKEIATLNWLEENKKFKVSGSTSDGVDVSWTYDITDSGITMTAKASDADKTDNVSNISEAWVNIPISYKPNDEVVINHENGKLSQAYRGDTIEFTWDSALDSEFSEIVDSDGSVYHTLRIKLPSSGEVSVDIENLSYGKSDEVVASNEKKYEWISNSKYQETEIFTEGDTVSFSIDVTNKKPVSKDVTVILKAYTENNEILDVFSKTANIEWYKTNTIKVDKVKLPAGTKYIDVLLWENFGTLKPYIEPSNITVEKK